jgi:hypothetical protein
VLFGAQSLLDEAGEVNSRVNAINTVAVSVALANPDMDVFAEPEPEDGPVSFPAAYGSGEFSSTEVIPAVQSRTTQPDDGLLPE